MTNSGTLGDVERHKNTHHGFLPQELIALLLAEVISADLFASHHGGNPDEFQSHRKRQTSRTICNDIAIPNQRYFGRKPRLRCLLQRHTLDL